MYGDDRPRETFLVSCAPQPRDNRIMEPDGDNVAPKCSEFGVVLTASLLVRRRRRRTVKARRIECNGTPPVSNESRNDPKQRGKLVRTPVCSEVEFPVEVRRC